MKSRRKADKAPKSEPVSDDEWLTQYGNRIRPIGGRAFKNRPPYPDQVNALSLTLGRLSVAEATEAIRTSTNRPSPGSGVRYTTGGKLRLEGFSARHTGNNRNPRHVSVTCLDESREWTDDDSDRFDACFDDPVWHEGGVR
jgi:hypothetical protein